MIDIDKKIEKIEKECYENARKELSEIKQINDDEYEKEISEKIENYKEELAKKYENDINKIQREYNKYLFDYEMQERIKINNFKQTLLDNIKSKVEEEFFKFTDSYEYENYLFSNIQETLQKIGDSENCEVYVTEKDYYRFNEKIYNSMQVNLLKIENNNIGGCKIVNIKKRISIDNTIKTNIGEKIRKIII